MVCALTNSSIENNATCWNIAANCIIVRKSILFWSRVMRFKSCARPETSKSTMCSKYVCVLKGLRPVLEGFVVPMHEGACETGSQIPRAYCSQKPECIGTTNPDRSVLITIITWHFQFHPVNVSNLRVKGAYVLEARAVSRAPPIVTSRGAP